MQPLSGHCQEYKPEVKGVSNASHVDLPRIYWQTEVSDTSSGENVVVAQLARMNMLDKLNADS